MTKLKDIIKQFAGVANKAPERPYENVWLQKSKQTEDGKYINLSTTVDQMISDKTDEYIYNVWSDLSEDGLSDFDKIVETELIPNGMRTLRDTANLSSDQGSIRYMIARPMNS